MLFILEKYAKVCVRFKMCIVIGTYYKTFKNKYVKGTYISIKTIIIYMKRENSDHFILLRRY